MSLYFEREELLNLLEPLASAVVKNAMQYPPTPECVRITTTKNSNAVKLSSCNIDMQIKTSGITSTVCNEDADILVDYFKLVQILKLSGAPGITLTIKKEKLIIEGGGTWTMPIMEGLAAMELDVGELQDAGIVSSSDFARLLNTTSQFAATEEERYVLAGVHFNFKKEVNRLELVATDTFRLALCPVIIKDVTENLHFTVPKKNASALARIFKDCFEIGIEANENIVSFSGKIDETEITVYTRLLDGKFPGYNNIIPDLTKFEKTDFNPEEMLPELEKALVAAEKETKRITMLFSASGISISAKSNSIDLYAKSLFANKWEGSEIEIDLNGEFIKTALKNLDCEAEIFIKSKNDQLILSDIDSTFIISPIFSREE